MPDGAGWFRQDFSGPVLLRGSRRNPPRTPTGLSPSVARLSSALRLYVGFVVRALQPPAPVGPGFGLLPVRSPLLGESLDCFLLLRLLRCFNSAGWPSSKRSIRPKTDGLPHSDTCGSRPVCGSPQLFAACHVLHRLTMPRHPPCALSYFRLYGLHPPSPEGQAAARRFSSLVLVSNGDVSFGPGPGRGRARTDDARSYLCCFPLRQRTSPARPDSGRDRKAGNTQIPALPPREKPPFGSCLPLWSSSDSNRRPPACHPPAGGLAS